MQPERGVRPEPFGALLYHFGTRRLSFLKTPQLVDVVQGLATPSRRARRASRPPASTTPQRPAYLRALAGLAAQRNHRATVRREEPA